MLDPVMRDLDNYLAACDADDARQEAIDKLANETQGDIDWIMQGEEFRGMAAWSGGKSCIDAALADFDYSCDELQGLLLAISRGGDATGHVESLKSILKASAYEQATIKAEAVIDAAKDEH